MVILIGKVGGTVIVTKSSPLLIKVRTSMNLCSLMVRTAYEMTVKKNKKNKNLVDSFWRVFYNWLGYSILRINCPLRVVKLVLVTQTGRPYCNLYFYQTCSLFLELIWTIVVP